MWLLKLLLNLRLSLLTFNLLVILKAMAQFGGYQENAKRAPSILQCSMYTILFIGLKRQMPYENVFFHFGQIIVAILKSSCLG